MYLKLIAGGVLLLFLLGCTILDIQSELEDCLPKDYYKPENTEQCFYEAMHPSLDPEQILSGCTKLKKEGEYDYRDNCYSVLIHKFKFRYEELLSQVLEECENEPTICKINVLGAYGDKKECLPLKDDLNITIDGKKVFPSYNSCVDLTKHAADREVMFEAVAQKDIKLCQTLDKLPANVCLFMIAQKTSAQTCDKITEDSFFKDYCKCTINTSEPYVVCIDIASPFLPDNDKKCQVKKGEDVIEEKTLKRSERKDFEIKHAPCKTSWKYSEEKTVYDKLPYWTS